MPAVRFRLETGSEVKSFEKRAAPSYSAVPRGMPKLRIRSFYKTINLPSMGRRAFQMVSSGTVLVVLLVLLVLAEAYSVKRDNQQESGRL